MSELAKVVRVAIHPAIGVARVGNSRKSGREGHFLCPELPGQHPLLNENEDARDGSGALRRQGVRFRLFGMDADGRVIRELTAADARITWRVRLANKKAAWHEFQQAFDIPASKGEIPNVRPLASVLRNRSVTDRARLVVDPGERILPSVVGARSARFDNGTFLGTRVDLGEAFLDDDGRLIVLGGFGEAASPDGRPITDFANNDGWYDDVSDGPVDATVEIGGRKLEAVGAWVIVGPPNFAPGITPFITGWDVALEVMISKGLVAAPVRPAFDEHIRPILQRLSAAQWVNSGFALTFGWGSPADFSAADMLARLSDKGEATRPLRQAVFASFRDPFSTSTQADRIPAVYGDAILIDPKTTDPREWMAILETQYGWLRQWADGDFDPGGAPPRDWDALSPAERAHALDRAALEDCTGGPFHPGIEFTWPLRQPLLYDDAFPFRIKRRTVAEPAPADQLTSSLALARGGPLDGSLAGDLTRWMALPWQGDTASCLSAYEDYAGEYVPTFWPARVPNDVITAGGYAIVMDSKAKRDDREKAFAVASRRKWLRGVSYDVEDTPKPRWLRIAGPQRFATSWSAIGVVVRKPGPLDLKSLPREMWVETFHSEPPQPPAGGMTPAAASPVSARDIRRRSRLDR